MSCCQMLKFSMSKLIMELVGTLLFTMFFTCGTQSVILLGLWITNIFFWKISGSHFNPAITFAYIFRKDQKMDWKLALAYIVAQTLGAYIGALLVNFYTFELAELTFMDTLFFRALTQELLCSFMYVFFFMANTDDKSQFSNEKAINCFILACSYIGARTIFYGNANGATSYGAVMNPATAMGIQMAGLFNQGLSSWNSLYLYPVVPFAGSFAAVLFYELIYKNTQAVLNNDDHSVASDADDRNDSIGRIDDGVL